MNLLFICDEYPPGPHGGIGTAVQILARALVEQGHQVVVAGFYDWGYGGADYEVDKGVEVYRYRRKGSGRWAQKRKALAVRIAYRLLRKSGFFQTSISASLPGYDRFLHALIQKHRIVLADISDFQDYTQHLKRETLLPSLPVPYVVTIHGTLTNCNKGIGLETPAAVFETEKALLENADGIIAVSRFALEETRRNFMLPLQGMVLFNGLPPEDFVRSIGPKAAKRVAFSGTLVALKGIYQLVKAWNIVIQKIPDAQLDVYGRGALNHLLPLLSEAARKSITFHGHTPREALLEKLRQAPIAVFPSYTETFGLGAAEAMASGCAVIYTQRAAGPELIAENVDGLLVDPDDVEGLAGKIIYLLQNPELCNGLAHAALRRARQQFDVAALAEARVHYYKTLLGESASN